MTTTYKVLLGVALLLGVIAILLPSGSSQSVLGGTTNLDNLTLSEELNVAGIRNTSGTVLSGTQTISGATTFSGNVTIGSAGTAISEHLSGTATWDPPAVTSSTPAEIGVAITGVALTDTVICTIATSTLGLGTYTSVSSTADRVVFGLFLPDGDSTESVNLGSATVRCDAWTH